MPPSAREYFQHILDETAYLLKSSHGLDKATFLQDETLKRAYVRSIEIIGDATKQLPDALRHRYPANESSVAAEQAVAVDRLRRARSGRLYSIPVRRAFGGN